MKKFCSSLREYATNAINFEKKKMFPLTKRSYNYTKMQQNVIFVEKNSQKSLLNIKIIKKLETIAILQVNIEMQHLVCVI